MIPIIIGSVKIGLLKDFIKLLKEFIKRYIELFLK